MTMINSAWRNVIDYDIPRVCIEISAYILLLAASSLTAQQATVSSYQNPAELVRKAVQNEIKAANDDSARFLFRGIKTTPQGSTTRIYVETKDATAGLVIAYNDKPLAPEQRRDEEARVQRFIDHPEELQKKREQERANEPCASRERFPTPFYLSMPERYRDRMVLAVPVRLW
jgi:hypothetical protein